MEVTVTIISPLARARRDPLGDDLLGLVSLAKEQGDLLEEAVVDTVVLHTGIRAGAAYGRTMQHRGRTDRATTLVI